MSVTKKDYLGEKALKIIADYPLYASTSGITYKQAIAIAKVIVPLSEWDDWLKDITDEN